MGALAVVLVTVFLLVIALANALVNNATVASALLVTNMDCHTLEPLLAEAQSVPAASEVMCIRSLPPGWTLNRVQALRGTSAITLGNDRAGQIPAIVGYVSRAGLQGELAQRSGARLRLN